METIEGKVLYLPSKIPRSSIIFGQLRPIEPQTQRVRFTHFDRPVLVLRKNPRSRTVEFLPIITLPAQHCVVRIGNSRLVWPRYVLLDQAWCKADIAQRARDKDFQDFPTARLAQGSLRVGGKLWVLTNEAWEIEPEHLLPYPLPCATPWAPKTLPNPPVYVDPEPLDAIYSLAAIHQDHPICIEPRAPHLATPPHCISIGRIYRLPLITTCPYLKTTESYSFYERPLGKPFLVTQIYRGNSTTEGVRVTGFVITNFNFRPIGRHFHRRDSKTRWIRSQYLPIEGATAELHDEVPSVELAGGSPQLRGSSYIHCLKSYTINADELLTWTVAGREEVCVGEGSLTFLTKYSELLQGIKVMGLSYFRRTEMVHKFLTETGEGIGQEYYAPSQP